MRQYQTAIILISCSILLGIGSYMLFSDSPEEGPMHREKVQQLTENTPTAPSWVKNGQDSKPDYAPSTAEAQNATPVPVETIGHKKTQIIEVTEDKIVTFTFVESLADFMLHRFQPQNAKGKPVTLASAKALNMYYGQELDGFAVAGDDIRMARKQTFDYAFNPKMIRILYDLYTPFFMAYIVETANNDKREYKVKGTAEQRVLSNDEIKAMLKLNADKIEQTATIFQAIADDPAITEMAGKYLRAAKAVERANVQLQVAVSEEKDTSAPGQRLKQAILQRERIKATTSSRLKKACPNCTNAELFYLAQWAYRRVLNGPKEQLESFGVAAEVLNDLAGRFRAQSDELE
ncbi:MAG: hypothetical protein JEY79_11590 [Pseudodesulfovibrio sp.]|nr:hypothetical protein [Pseudodesulfovibrio sp.]